MKKLISLALACWLLWPSPGLAAFGVENTCTVNQGAEDTSVSCNVTTTAANLLVVVCARGQSGGTGVIDSVTHNADALSLVSRSETGGQWGIVEIWKRDNPDLGSNLTVTATLDVADIQFACGAIGFTEASLTLGTPATGGGTSANPSVNATTVAGDIVVGGLVTDEGSNNSSTPNGTVLFDFEDVGSGDSDLGAQRVVASGTTTAVGWTQATTAQHWQIGAVPVSSGAAPSSGLLLRRRRD